MTSLRPLSALLFVALLVVPTSVPLIASASESEEEQPAADAALPFDASAAHANLDKLEGWAFLGEGHADVLGRTTARLEWSDARDRVSGTLRVPKGATYAIEADEDAAAWADRDVGTTIRRYVGQATPLEGGEARALVLDVVPAQGYASGYLEAAGAAPRVSLQLYDSPAIAVNRLADLLGVGSSTPDAPGVAPAPAQANANPLPRLPLPGAGPATPIVMPPKALTPSGPATPLVGGASGPALVQYPLVGPGHTEVMIRTGEGQHDCGSNCNQEDPPNYPPDKPSTPLGPSTVPVNEPGLFEASSKDVNGDQVKIVFRWGDGSPDTAVEYNAGNFPQAASHTWNRTGTFSVTAYAMDIHNATSQMSEVLRVQVVDPDEGLPADIPTLPPTVPTVGPPPPALVPPSQPAPPVASTRLTTPGQPVTFEAVSYDPLNTSARPTSIRYRFSWDDGTYSWSDWTVSGHVIRVQHEWSGVGSPRVQVQAKNSPETDCHTSGGSPVLTCYSPWSAPTTITIASSISGNAPLAPTRPGGWDNATVGSTTVFNATATDPNGDAVRYEFDWGDGSLHTVSGLVPSGTQASLPHTWNRSGIFYVRARALDAPGLPGPWSAPTYVFIGTQPFELAVKNASVDKTTPRAANLTDTDYALDPNSPTLVSQGDFVNIWATLENRGAQDVVIDVTWADDGKAFDARPYFIPAGGSILASSTEQSAGLFTPGVHELSVTIASRLDPLVEVTKANNVRKVDIWVRDAIAGGDGGYGALYDGKGPVNGQNVQLTTGLYSHARTGDINSFDEIPQGASAATRLLVWSANLTGIPNQTWYFTDSVDANVQAVGGLSFSSPAPSAAHVGATLHELIPLTIGYSERSGSGTVSVGMDYDVKAGSTFSSSPTSLSWHILTNRTPTDATHAVGFQFVTAAGSASATNAWRNVTYDASVSYTRVQRQGDGTLLLWHEIVRTGSAPIVSSVETGVYGASAYYPTGDDYNVGDRSMISLPVWNATANQRRTYFDGTTDKSASEQDAKDPAGVTFSSAYAWFRLDGPIYKGHTIVWVFTGPDGVSHDSPPYRLEAPAEGSFFGWAEFYDEIRFPDGLPASQFGRWIVTVYVDGSPTTTMTFNFKGATNDPSDGPTPTTDEELDERVEQASDSAASTNVSNENLPNLDPNNKDYLERRAGRTVEAETFRVDNVLSRYLRDYLINQSEEVLNAGLKRVDPILPEPIAKTVKPVLYDAVDEARDLPSTHRIAKSVTRAVWEVGDAILDLCGVDIQDPDPEQAVAAAADCATRIQRAADEVTPLARETAGRVLDPPGTTLDFLPTALTYASGIAGLALTDPAAAVNATVSLVNATTAEASQTVADVLPPPPVPVNMNPKFLADNLVLVYDTVMQSAPPQARDPAVSAADALFYNVYVANEDGSRTWTEFNVGIGNVTPIDFDADSATGTRGADILVTATLTPTLASTPAAMTDVSQTAPTLRVQALTQAVRDMPLVACAYYQLPGVAFVAATCVDTRNATLASLGAPTPGAGFPESANVTLSAYAFDPRSPNATATLRLESQGGHATLPILAVGSVFQVDLAQHTKPRASLGDHADAALYSANGQGSAQFDLHRTLDPAAGTTSEWSWTASTTGSLAGSYSLAREGRALVASSNVTSPPAKLDIKAARDAKDATLGVTVQSAPPAQPGRTTFALQDGGEAFSLAADALPAALTLSANDTAGTVTLGTQGGAPSGLQVVAANARAACSASTQAQNQVVRQPVDGDGGACLVARLVSPVQALSVNLASGGPSLSLTSQEASSAALAVLVRPGDFTTRSLDAYLSRTPLSASLQSSLAQPDGSTTLSWAATEELAKARVQARSGSTLLYWDATDAPTATQAAYQWSGDAVAVRTSAPNRGAVQLYLTNTGKAPTIPTGDYVAGTRAANGDFAAAARLTGVSDLRATLATQDFRVDATGSAGQPLAVRYLRDGGSAFTLDANPLPAGSLSLHAAGKEGGTHRLDYASGGRGGTLRWAGNFREGAHAEGDIADAPASFAFTASPTAGTLDLNANGDRAGRFEVVHAAAGATASTLAGEDTIHLRSTPGGGDVYRASLRDVRSLTLAKSPGSLVILGDQTADRALHAQVGDGEDFFDAQTTLLPDSVQIAYGRTGLNYTASNGAPAWTVRSMEDGSAFGFTSVGTPTQTSLAWASTTQTAALAASHNAANLPLLHLEASFAASDDGSGSDFVRVKLDDAPPSVTATFNRGTDEIALSAGPAPARVVQYQHAANVASIQVPAEPSHVIMRRDADGVGGFEALRLENATSATLRLGSQAGQTNRLQIDAPTPRGFYAEYASERGDALAARLSSLPARTDLQYALAANQGTANATGMTVRQASTGGSIASVKLHAVQARFTLDADVASASAAWDATWAPGQPLAIHASPGTRLNALAYRLTGELAPIVPGAHAFLLVDDARPDAPRVGAAFPMGVTLASSDVALRAWSVSAAAHTSLRVRHQDAGIAATLNATSPPANLSLQAPPVAADGRATLAWVASGATSALAWGLDAPDARWRWSATALPDEATLRLDPAQGIFVASVPDGAGPVFRAQYTTDPVAPYYGKTPGLVLLANAAGAEYPPGVTTFTLDVPRLAAARADFATSLGVNVTRAGVAPLTNVDITLAAGPEALDFSASGVSKLLDTEWAVQGANGLHGSVISDATLQDARVGLRGKDGLGAIRIATLGSPTTLDLGPGAQGAALDYANAALSSSVTATLSAAGADVDLSLTSAPHAFHAQAPLRCGADGAQGRAWAQSGESVGFARFALAPASGATVPDVPEAQRLVATCDANAATIQIDLPGLKDAKWTTDRAGGIARIDVQSAAASAAPTRLVLRGSGNNDVLDASTTALPASILVTGETVGSASRAAWSASQNASSAKIIYIAPHASVNATLTNAPASWSVSADPADPMPLAYAGGATASRVVAEASTEGLGARFDASDVPTVLAWIVPVAACPAPTATLDATISTLGTGSVGSLAAWTLPGPAADFVDETAGEHAILACDDNGARTLVSLRGVKEIAWSRTVSAGVAMRAAAPPLPALPPVAAPPTLDVGQAVAPLPAPGPILGLAGAILPAPLPAPFALPSLRAPAANLPEVPAPSPTTAAAAGVGAPLTTTNTLSVTRDPVKVDAAKDVVQRLDGANGQGMSTVATAPASSVSTTYVVAPQSVAVHQTHDLVNLKNPGAVITAFAGEYTSGVHFIDPPDRAQLTLDGTGSDFAIDYDASGKGGGLRVNTKAAGPSVYLDVKDIPSRFVGSMKGPTPGGPNVPDCSGARSPVGVTFNTLGQGNVTQLGAIFSDHGAHAQLATGWGATFACHDGKNRAFAGNFGPTSQFSLVSGACSAPPLLLEADSQHMANYHIQTPSFDLDVQMQMTPTTVALVKGTFADDKFGFQAYNVAGTVANTAATFATLSMGYQKLGGEDPSASLPASCLNFGPGAGVASLHATTTMLKGSLDGDMGQDALARKKLAIDGGGADTLDVTVRTDPPKDAGQAAQDADEPTHLALTVSMPINTTTLQFSQGDAMVPSPDPSDRDGSYAYLGMGNGFNGGNIKILGFQDASLTLDRNPDTKQTVGKAAFNMTQISPFALVVQDADSARMDVRLGALPAQATAAFNFQEKAVGLWGDFDYSASASTSVEFRKSAKNEAETIVSTPALPATAHVKFEASADEHDLMYVSLLRYTASAAMKLDVESNHIILGDPSHSQMRVHIDSLPPGFSGDFLQNTCGFSADADLGQLIQRIEISFHSSDSSRHANNGPGYVSPECPRPKDQSSTSGPSSLDIEATVIGIPAGDLSLTTIAGPAGIVRFKAGGPIASADASVTTGKGEVITASASTINLRTAEWDIDGDTRYPGAPVFIYLDTEGSTAGRIVVHHDGPPKGNFFNYDTTFHVDTRGSFGAWKFQIQPQGLLGFLPKVNGCLKLYETNRLYLELPGSFLNWMDFAGGIGTFVGMSEIGDC